MIETCVDNEGEPNLKGPSKTPKEKVQEVLVIHDSHAVTYPGTVMIHSHNAGVTYRAVMRPWRFDLLTVMAVTVPYVASQFIIEVFVYFDFDLLP